MDWWAWVSVRMRSELINAFGTHGALEIQEYDAGLGLW